MSQIVPSWATPFATRPSLQIAVVVIGLGFAAGTGGLQTGEYVLNRGVRGYPIPGIVITDGKTKSEHEIAIQLDAIRSALRLSVRDLADIFGVSRQTIYNWQRGEALDEKNESRVREIASAVSSKLAILETQVGRPALRALPDGNSLLHALAKGFSASDSLGALAGILSREAEQRASMAQHLKGRRSNRGAADFDALS